MTNLYFIRHAHTILNGKMLFQGGQTDSNLDETGIEQINKSRKNLNNALPDEYLLICSPLLRTKQTAEKLKLHPLKTIFDSRLKEIDFGEWEGKSLDSVRKEYPFQVRQYYNNDPSIVMPKGESINSVAIRMKEAIKDYSSENYNNIVFISHGNSISIGLSSLLLDNNQFHRILDVPRNVSLSKVCINGAQASLNFYNHIFY